LNLKLLGHTEIDKVHTEFIDLVEQLSVSPKENFSVLFSHFLRHTEEHFQMEDELMLQYNDPNLSEHQAEHRRIINELKQFEQRASAGRISFAKAYIKDKLPEWFKLHTSTIDSALISHIQKHH